MSAERASDALKFFSSSSPTSSALVI
jgi:hypothetical protein